MCTDFECCHDHCGTCSYYDSECIYEKCDSWSDCSECSCCMRCFPRGQGAVDETGLDF